METNCEPGVSASPNLTHPKILVLYYIYICIHCIQILDIDILNGKQKYNVDI